MAARDLNPRAEPLPSAEEDVLSPSALDRRIDEEISRAERHGTQLSCLMVVIDDVEELVREHGSELPEETLAYMAGALRHELRRFDRIGRPGAGELAIVLPGADGPLGEVVARRVLDRVRAIKVESRGTRRPLQISVGLAAWRRDMSAQELLARTRAATRPTGGEDPPATAEVRRAAAHDGSPAQAHRPHAGRSPAFERPAPS
jgi:diguanylate cyclase (GGDEF)-like protein